MSRKVTAFSLSTIAQEGLRLLADELHEGNLSATVEALIRHEMGRRGYSLKSELWRSNHMKISIIGDEGEFPLYSHEGQLFCAAQKGKEYKIRVKNTTSNRVLAVISVDGINIVNGKEAAKGGQGYVLDPFQDAIIPGWTRTNDEVAAFTFSEVGGGYSKQIGKGTDNVGVIGLAAFKEIPRTHWVKTVTYSSGGTRGMSMNSRLYSADSIPVIDTSVCCSTASSEEKTGGMASGATLDCFESGLITRAVTPGLTKNSTTTKRRRKKATATGQSGTAPKVQDTSTAYGAKKDYRTETISFDHQEEPFEVTTIRYASRKVLESWGVPMNIPFSTPNAFPADKVNCPAPPGWQG